MTGQSVFIEPQGAQKLKVFISYSRQDLTFADELAAGLGYDGGFDILIDRHDIHEGEDWRARLGSLIAAADTIVFVLSPDSASSPICKWEVEQAERLSKRILPVQAVTLVGSSPPRQLAALNFVRFDPHEDGRPRSFMEGLTGLRRALSTNLEWLREHTRLLTRAEEWDRAGRVESRLLVGNDIDEARKWMERQPQDAPSPIELHHEYITASEQAQAQRLSAEREHVRQLETAIRDAEEARGEELAASRRAARRSIVGIVASVTLGAGGLAAGWGYKLSQERLAFERQAMRTDIKGQIIAYATAKGEPAFDAFGSSKTSPYTTPLLETLRTNRKLSIVEALTTTRDKVVANTEGRQTPFLSTSMNGEIFPWHQPESRKRVAIVAWLDYNGHPYLPNLTAPRHDAEGVRALLREVGYEEERIIVLKNPRAEDLRSALASAWEKLDVARATDRAEGAVPGRFLQGENFSVSAQPEFVLTGLVQRKRNKPEKLEEPEPFTNSLLLFYYSGNGFSSDGQSYLVPLVSETVNMENFSAAHGVNVDDLAREIATRVTASVLILDTNFPEIR